MTEGFPNEGRLAQRIGEDGDRWRCSLCNGYVRGNAPLCKHCHAHFGAPEPSPSDETVTSSETQQPLTLKQKVAVGFILAFTVVICVGCYLLAIRIGGYAGITAGWLLAPALVTLIFFITPISFRETFEQDASATFKHFLIIWLLLTLLVLPIMLCYLIDFHFSAWWDRPLALSIMFTLYTLIGKALSIANIFKSDPNDSEPNALETLNFLGEWRKTMLTYILPFTALIFIGERLNLEFLYMVGFILLVHTRLRNWLWQQAKALWQRARGTSSAQD